ncbi:phosphate acetyltransferase [Rippkaea orientalis PCC 8801]|uniref:Phosphate acetyltransferase n=1 Tax=Rippkaea orientalis (strain PCC 8801 / RF-1) TaxID=41431 RepID=B7K0F7_RIPO1|nr:phosphate acetyltransferase [Rippkaea orientalis]ACK67441.1 phosphate acetyltransferase [Rippkaea orientalis PCC 8801]
MTNSLYIATTEGKTGKSLISLGIMELLLRKTTRVGFFRPIIQDPIDHQPDQHLNLILSHFNLPQSYEESYGLPYSEVSNLMGHQNLDEILEIIITKYKKLEETCDFILCEGSDYLKESSAFEFDINAKIAKNLGCSILILGNGYQKSVEEAIAPIEIAVDTYREKQCPIIGIIINKADQSQLKPLKNVLEKDYKNTNYLLSIIPYDKKLGSPRIREIAQQLNAQILYGRDRLDNLVFNYLVAAMQMQHAISQFDENCLVVTPSDRGDVIIGTLQAHQSTNYPNLAGILLTTEYQLEQSIAQLISGLTDPLPILWVNSYTYPTVSDLKAVYSSLIPEDTEKIDWSIDLFDQFVNLMTLEKQISTIEVKGITPKMFTYNLIQQAKTQKRHIVLPEGNEPRILKAAEVLLSKNIVDLTLLGQKKEIERIVKTNNIQLDIQQLTIINPIESAKFDDYVQTFYDLRKHKGATLETAHDCIMDVSYFGTMMVYKGDADGMVSGAIHTTSHTIRPALQIIKTQPDISLVSSVFFMCLNHNVLVYGDCAVNPNPTAEELAEIAITSAETAKTFDITPKVALLSYSSGESGQGEEVEKVRKAAQISQKRRQDLAIEGPIQYDAAIDPQVAAQKMPNSRVAGQATVFIFPDLNTGNNTYKAVQRATGAIAIGPILQGLKKPVNDLSRGCTVGDIINTVVITAIQSQIHLTGRMGNGQ